MNILLFVTSLLMILSILTYARIDNFRYFLGMQAEFERYMRSIERLYINDSAEVWYDTTIATRRQPAAATPPSTPAAAPTEAGAAPVDTATPIAPTGSPTSRLSLKVLFDQKLHSAHENAYHQTREWFKQLMKELYSEQLFFKKMAATHSDFLNELIAALENTIQALPENERPKTAADLANLNLEGEFKEVFYLMLKGCPKEELLMEERPEEKADSKPKIIISGEAVESIPEDESDDANEAIEYSSPQGYDSLLNYITMRNTTKIRVYLASRELLSVIFKDPTIVEAVIKMRMSLYKMVLKDLPPADATKQFQVAFQGVDTPDAESILDFKVTKTNPSDYD